MPKPTLAPDQQQLESQLIETLMAGLKEWRPDLHYPESYSDMQACVRAMLRMFEIKRRPLVLPLKIVCHECDGLGKFIRLETGVRHINHCERCNGRGYIEG